MKRGNFRYLQICYVMSRKLQSLLPFNEGNLPFRAWGPGGYVMIPLFFIPHAPRPVPRGIYALLYISEHVVLLAFSMYISVSFANIVDLAVLE